MKVHRLVRSQRLPMPRGEVFAFFENAENLGRITPPSLDFRILTETPIAMGEGTLIDYRIKLHGVPMRWRTVIERYEPRERFVDRQLRGPYALWRHTHEFHDDGDGTLMLDDVEYAIGFGPLGELAHRLFVERTLEHIFDYRRDAIVDALATRVPHATRAREAPVSPP